MYLRLQGAHYDLAVPRESMKTIFSNNDSDGDDESEEGYKPTETHKSTEEKLIDIEEKYVELKKAYAESLREIKSLKSKPIESGKEHNKPETTSDATAEEELIVRSKSKGFKKTSPQYEPEARFKCDVCKETFKKEYIFNKHIETHNNDGDWTCGEFECSFQTISEEQLKKHKHIAHPPGGLKDGAGRQESRGVRPMQQKGGSSNDCHTCNKEFVYKIDLVKHVRETHRAYKPCRDIKKLFIWTQMSLQPQTVPRWTPGVLRMW